MDTKIFVIDHPTKKENYLVHACLEGPEAGVYYRGIGKIINNNYAIIELPDYVEYLATDLTVQITQIYDEKFDKIIVNNFTLKSSRVKNNKFSVFGENCEFFWIVHGKRNSIKVEPAKSFTQIKGSGPYKWITSKLVSGFKI